MSNRYFPHTLFIPILQIGIYLLHIMFRGLLLKLKVFSTKLLQAEKVLFGSENVLFEIVVCWPWNPPV